MLFIVNLHTLKGEKDHRLNYLSVSQRGSLKIRLSEYHEKHLRLIFGRTPYLVCPLARFTPRGRREITNVTALLEFNNPKYLSHKG